MEQLSVYLTALLFSFFDLADASVCYSYDTYGNYWSNYSEYCAFGCCGYSYSVQCCPATWPIVGIVVGCSVVIAVIVTIVCCCRRSQGTRGLVCQTNPGTTTTVLNAGQFQAAGYPAQTVVTYSVQPSYPAYPAQTGYVYQQAYPVYSPYPQTTHAGLVASSNVSYTDQPDVKPTASAPPMEPPPPYPQ